MMSKTKLAILLFILAFGVNVLSFVFTKKAFVIEEVKNVWLYELPLTASPLDSYVAVDLAPQNGVIGTLFTLMESSEWKSPELIVNLKPGLTFSTGEAILPEHWNESWRWSKELIKLWKEDPLWKAFLDAEVEWTRPSQVRFKWAKVPLNLDMERFKKAILSHPMTGVFHPENLKALTSDPVATSKALTRKWISSGPYRIRKWNPKEIILVSRDDFPVSIPKEFFRTLKFQSAPVKNPSCDFMQSQLGEEKTLQDHRVNPVHQTLHLYWVCRSWKERGSFCSNPENREKLSRILTEAETKSPLLLSGEKIRYRIPFGSDSFREEIIQKLKNGVQTAGGQVEEVSYLFQPSTETDLELLFVVADTGFSPEMTEKMARLSSRLGWMGEGAVPARLVGEYARYPIQVLMKNMKGEPFSKLFLEPDLEEKRLPL